MMHFGVCVRAGPRVRVLCTLIVLDEGNDPLLEEKGHSVATIWD